MIAAGACPPVKVITRTSLVPARAPIKKASAAAERPIAPNKSIRVAETRIMGCSFSWLSANRQSLAHPEGRGRAFDASFQERRKTFLSRDFLYPVS
jgi:hypothetical protein